MSFTDTQKGTILIVDDTPDQIELLFQYLAKSGFQVWLAQDGESALRQVGHTPPDVMLLDVMMPGLDGFETCRRLKENKTTKEIPVIFMTGLTDIEHKITGFQIGGVDYVTKPLEPQEVLARLTAHITIRNLQKDLQQKNAQLEEALNKIKTLSGLIPICASCKNIRDDQGYWHKLEAYIQDHAEVEFSHGLCPDCAKKLYPDFVTE